MRLKNKFVVGQIVRILPDGDYIRPVQNYVNKEFKVLRVLQVYACADKEVEYVLDNDSPYHWPEHCLSYSISEKLKLLEGKDEI